MYKYNYPDLGSYTYGIYALVSQKKKNNKQTNKLENQSRSHKMSLFSTQANINWTLYVLSHAPANSGWRSDSQILDLKQHVHRVVKLDSLTVG